MSPHFTAAESVFPPHKSAIFCQAVSLATFTRSLPKIIAPFDRDGIWAFHFESCNQYVNFLWSFRTRRNECGKWGDGVQVEREGRKATNGWRIWIVIWNCLFRLLCCLVNIRCGIRCENAFCCRSQVITVVPSKRRLLMSTVRCR